MKTPAFYILYLALATLVIGCATYRSPIMQRSIWEDKTLILEKIQGEIQTLSLQEIWETIISSNADLRTFRSQLDITLNTPGIKGPLHCRGSLVYQKPNNLRIIGSKFLTTLFDISSHDDEFRLHVPPEGKLYKGTLDTYHKIETLGMHIFPADIVSLFNYKEVLTGEKVALETWPTYWLVHLLEMDTRFVNLKGKLSLDRVNADVFRCDLFNTDGSIRLQALFTDYTTVEDCRVPQRIDVRWPSYETTLGITFSLIGVNIPLDPKVFTPSIPGGVQIHHLH
ncbi:MAG: hypothetical protein ACUBOA_04820 [Candidatus Loosdrechtia sp.]|uniref:hypothetical protein n=1 Tax=Candidatus Loosdrechtia sp. TaxID=3101272 RepID=UPI003A75A202|nr:MAG: hypothetical protein QY305_14390 [Candidatus Jettenia sp. AMX2]